MKKFSALTSQSDVLSYLTAIQMENSIEFNCLIHSKCVNYEKDESLQISLSLTSQTDEMSP